MNLLKKLLKPKVRAPLGFSPVYFKGYKIFVANDYYMFSGPKGKVRLPVSGPQADFLLRKFNMLMPTKDLVDATWEQADIKLDPILLAPDSAMITSVAFDRHSSLIDEQLEDYISENVLIAGHKKDLVWPKKTGRVAIYGWHRRSGKPIQPYSNVHYEDYRDYSHGLRFVYPMAKEIVKGKEFDVPTNTVIY